MTTAPVPQQPSSVVVGTYPAYQNDPSELTTKQLHREITVLHELIKALFDGVEQINTQKFAAVQREFVLAESQRQEQKMDTKAAVDAALTAQKEAVKEQTIASDRAIAKSETAMTKQLEQLSANFTTAIHGVTAALNDSKDRITKIESTRVGGDAVGAKIISIISACAALVAIIVAMINFGR